MAHKRANSWLATGYDRTLGRKRHLGSFRTKNEALRREADWRLRAKATGRETCDSLAERWAKDYPRPRESTNLHNRERVKLFAKDFKGVRLEDVDRPAARAWALQHPHHLPAVRAMFSDAWRDGLTTSNPFVKLNLPQSRGRKDLVALTERELAGLADVALDARMELGEFGREYRAMILFAGYVGLRPGELFALRRDDLVGAHVTIERALQSKTRLVGPTKNGRPRTVIVPPAAQDALLEVQAKDSGLLFETPAGRMWSQVSNHRYWSRLRLLANRPGMDFYECRHCAATMMLERGATAADVAHQLGHTDGGILVATVYGHPAESGARARNLALWEERVEPLRSVDTRRREAS